MPGVFSTPRPLPGRLAPSLAGGAVIALALPVFLVAGLSLDGWVLGAVLWTCALALGLLLTRIGSGPGNLAAGVMGVGMTFRPVAVMVVAIAVAASDPRLGVTAALLYAAAYTLELGVGLAAYFGGRTA